MTAPGDSVLIFVLLALLVACGGYAAGRLHQRWQTSHDREQAYRDGYETGTRSVFSTAVRMLGPRRPVRASAPVQPAATPVQPASALVQPAAPVRPAAPAAPGSADLEPTALEAAAPEAAEADSSAPPPASEPAMGFPLPAPPPPYAVTEPSAVGGVSYRAFPDPRRTDAPVLREAPTEPRRRPRLADRSELALGTPGQEQADESQSAGSQPAGRHTVPDELVQAPTYRLPPDRIFRARVKESSHLPEEPTTKLSVPKPRNS